MCKPYIEFVAKHIKSVVFALALICGAIAFCWNLPSRISGCETRMIEFERRLTQDEKEFSMTSTRLEATLLQIQTDIQLIKQKLLSK